MAASWLLFVCLAGCDDAAEPPREPDVFPDRRDQGLPPPAPSDASAPSTDAEPHRDASTADAGLDAHLPIDMEPPRPDQGPLTPECQASDTDEDGYGTHASCVYLDCDDGNAAVYPGAVEACDGYDDDCDARIDEGLFTARCGVGACAREVPNCVDGRATPCAPGEPAPEACNGEDDDCDGAVDEGAADETCGVGACVRRASCPEGGEGLVCTPGEPSPEVCNGEDDDCDGDADEGLTGATVMEASYADDLSPRHGGCDGAPDRRVSPDCDAAINRLCREQACADTGFGPVENSGDLAAVTCLGVAELVNVPFAELSAEHPGCRAGAPRKSADCNAAMHRWCDARGHVSGFGPLEGGPDAALVACVGAGARVFEQRYSELVGQHPGCDGSSQRVGPECNAAIHRWCVGQGFGSGFGPIENNGDLAYVTCVAR